MGNCLTLRGSFRLSQSECRTIRNSAPLFLFCDRHLCFFEFVFISVSLLHRFALPILTSTFSFTLKPVPLQHHRNMSSSFTTQTVEVPHLGGIRASYHMPYPHNSSKPTLILVNSFTTNAKIYTPQYANKSLTVAVNLLAIEPLGHGGTRAMNVEQWTYWDTAIMNLQVMEKLGVERAFVLGTSQGGWVTVRMALLAPDKVGLDLYSLLSLFSLVLNPWSLALDWLSILIVTWKQSETHLAPKARRTSTVTFRIDPRHNPPRHLALRRNPSHSLPRLLGLPRPANPHHRRLDHQHAQPRLRSR